MNPTLVFEAVMTVIYPLFDLALLVLCLVLLRGVGGTYLAVGFGLQFLSSLTWTIVGLLHVRLYGTPLYLGIRVTTFLIFLASAVFLVLGFVKLAAVTSDRK